VTKQVCSKIESLTFSYIQLYHHLGRSQKPAPAVCQDGLRILMSSWSYGALDGDFQDKLAYSAAALTTVLEFLWLARWACPSARPCSTGFDFPVAVLAVWNDGRTLSCWLSVWC
jgi:hypothetical protein